MIKHEIGKEERKWEWRGGRSSVSQTSPREEISTSKDVLHRHSFVQKTIVTF
jgi:hypothetical protein